MAINAALLPTGKVLIYAYPQNPSWGPGSRNAVNKGVAAVIDPNTKQTVATRDMPNIWCSGTSFLPDGRVLVTGGTLAYTSYPRTWKGLNQTWTYNAFTNQWTQHANMRHGRWYPTQVQLPDGRSLITSGLDESGDANGQADAPLNKDVEIFNPADGSVSLASGPDTPLQGMYPHMWQMPSGRILVTGPYAKDTFYLQLTGATSYSVADAPNTAQQHYWARACWIRPIPPG